MPKTLLLLASPHPKGTSAMLLRRIGEDIRSLYTTEPETLKTELCEAETLVLSGPCYVNTYPAPVVEFLERAIDWPLAKNLKVYGIINGGMPYIHTHRSGVDMLRCFCEAKGIAYQGSFVLGGGAMLDGQPLERHISSKKIVPAYQRFVEHVKAGTASPDFLFINAQRPPGLLLTHFLAKMLTFNTHRRLKSFGHPKDAVSEYVSGDRD